MIVPEASLQLVHTRTGTAPPLDLQQLWFATLRWDWSSLVLVPADSNGSVDRLAKALAQVGELHAGRALKITEEGSLVVPTSELVAAMQDLPAAPSPNGANERRKKRTIVALEPIQVNPSGIEVAIAADAALLCVELGKTHISEARLTVEIIGREHFKGCILLR